MKDGSVRELITELHDMCQGAEECIYLLQNAFIYSSSKYLEECAAKAKGLHDKEKELTQDFVEMAKKNPDMKRYLSAPGHIERIGDNVESIIGCTKAKMKDGILFSDKAISEITFLLQRVQEVLKNMGDLVLTRNSFIAQYVKESQTEIGRSASEFATMHEERLIEGLCMPVASSLFLDILDAMKGIAWHAKEMTEKLTV